MVDDLLKLKNTFLLFLNGNFIFFDNFVIFDDN